MLFIPAVFVFMFTASPQGQGYPFISNIALLALGIYSYIEGALLALLLGGLCLAVMAVYLVSRHVNLIPSVFGLLSFTLATVSLVVLRRIHDGMGSLRNTAISSREKELSIVRQSDERLGGDLKELDSKVSDIASLYEITKEMSSALSFSEIFKIFSTFLEKNFKFKTCKLVLMDKGQPEKIQKVYAISRSDAGEDTAGPGDEDIMKKMAVTKSIVTASGSISIPLLGKGNVIGALTMEGLDEAYLERFLIVVRQFSLEIEKVQLYEMVQELAITDGLTGIYVRRYFMERFREEFERSVRHKFKMAFLMADLDDFKKCNDRFGHLVGDAVLKEVAHILKLNIREIDLLGRYGGEEFSVLLPETDTAGAVHVAERLRHAVAARTFKAYDETVRITISIGGCVFPQDASAQAELIEMADQALYEAKIKGRNKVVFKKR